jgi:hypothetical protein
MGVRRPATDLRGLRRRCEATIRDLEIPSPFDIADFCQQLSASRGRQISLQPMSAAISPCGVWLATDTADYIFYEQTTSPLHQEHIALHEVGHLLSDHRPTGPLDEAAALALTPHLDPGMVRRMLGRTTYSTEEEREAEMLAWLILERCGRGEGEPADEPAVAGLLHRLEATLEQPGQIRSA